MNWVGRCWGGRAFHVFFRKSDCICAPAFVSWYLLTESGFCAMNTGPSYAWTVTGDHDFTYYPLPIRKFTKLSFF